MAASLLICALFLSVAHCISPTLASPPTSPAFLWSDHRFAGLHTKGAVDYRVLSHQTLMDTLMQKFDWASVLCNSNINDGENGRPDAVVAFIGNKLHSEDIAHDSDVDSSPVLQMLKDYFSSSSYSMALPYVVISSENGGILNMLVSTIKDSCDLKTRPGKTVILGSCLKGKFEAKRPYLAEGIELVDSTESIKDFILSRKASRRAGETDIIVACPVSNVGIVEDKSEGDMLATVLSALRQSGTRNTVLYASDPSETTRSHRHNGRMLAANATTTTTTCDEVCKTIASAYEGVIVAVTLLIILISGLCCMMGIDTPSRFEGPQDS